MKTKRFICLLLLLALSLSCLSGCIAGLPSEGNSLKDKGTSSERESAKAPESSLEPEVQPTDAPAMGMTVPIISELYSLELSDNYGSTGSYHVPQINCDSADALAINREIAEHYGPIVEEEQGHIASNVSITCYEIEWKLIVNGDCFALIISRLYPNDCRYYDVYNFSAVTGAKMENTELLNQFNMEMYEFLDLAQAAAEDFFVTRANAVGVEQDDYYWELLEATISDDVICPDMPLFVNEDGGLSIITPIGSFAGAEFYWEIIAIT